MIFIPGNVPSSKNSKVKTATGLFNSKTVSKYLQSLGVKSYSSKNGVQEYKTRPNLFRQAVELACIKTDYPIILGMHFVRDSRRRFDFNNVSQVVCDLMVAHGFIEDDDCDHLYAVPLWMTIGGFYHVDKKAPGVFLEVLDRARFIDAVSVAPF